MHTRLSALPMPLSWQVPPLRCRTDEAASLTVQAPPGTDLFVDPGGGDPVLTAPRLLGTPPAGDFQLAARVTVRFAHTYDAGVLLVWADEGTWAKLCFERSPQGRPMAVSVVTRGSSDDANGFAVDGDQLWLRVSRLGPAWAFHAGTDGRQWQLVRYFSLPALPGSPATGGPATGGPATGGTAAGAPLVGVGFEAQSPTGAGCEAIFDRITFVPDRLADLRGGG